MLTSKQSKIISKNHGLTFKYTIISIIMYKHNKEKI